MVQAMPASEFIRFSRASRMLAASNQINAIEAGSFHSYKEKSRDEVMRGLKRASTQYLFTPLKDFKDVAANFAKRLKDGR